MASTSLPKFIVIKPVGSKGFAYYMNETKQVRGYVGCGEENLFNPFAKIEVEVSKSNPKYVHLRFCHSNKYWRIPANDSYISARLDQPEESLATSDCTLFEPTFGNEGKYLYLTHVKTGGAVRVDDRKSRIYISKLKFGSSDQDAFTFVDCDTLVKLPKFVAFKGDNGMYLKGVWYDGIPWKDARPYLQFSGQDFNHQYMAYEVLYHPDGHLRFKSVHFDKFLRSSPNWIWGDSSDANGDDINTLFWPVKLDDRTIALRSAGNDYFCQRVTAGGHTDCLTANSYTITSESRLLVQELVLDKSIYNVRYRMEDARVFDEMPFVAGTGTATNNSDTESTLSVKVKYEDVSSYTFTYNMSLSLGGEVSIQTGVPFIANGEIKFSTNLTNTFEWGKTKVKSKSSETEYTVKVPPMSRVVVDYVATEGKCSVPFSYTQRDKMSSQGNYVTSDHIDGIFHGVSYYSFHFKQHAVEPL